MLNVSREDSGIICSTDLDFEVSCLQNIHRMVKNTCQNSIFTKSITPFLHQTFINLPLRPVADLVVSQFLNKLPCGDDRNISKCFLTPANDYPR